MARLISFFHSRIGGIVLFALVAGAAALGAFMIERQALRTEVLEARAQAEKSLSRIAANIERHDAYRRLMTMAMANALSAQTDIDDASLAELARPILGTDEDTVAVGLAEGYVITHAYPREENRAIIGFDYHDDPVQFATVRDAIERDAAIFAGQTKLVQGGVGYIYRAPVFRADERGNSTYWGLVSVVCSDTWLRDEIRASIDNGYVVGVRDLTASADSPDLIWGEAGAFEGQPAVREIDLPPRSWQVALRPASGWPAVASERPVIWAVTGLLAAVVLVLLFWARGISNAKRKTFRQLNTAIESIEDGFALFGPDDRLVMCNSKYKSYYNASSHLIVPGASFEEILRGGVAQGQYRDAIGREEEWIAQRLREHANPSRPTEQHLADGRWLKVSETKLADGSTAGFRVDVTELKAAKEAAEAADRAKMEFINTMSHEIRTPLSAVIGFAAFLKNIHRLPAFTALRRAHEEGETGPEAGRKLDELHSDIVDFAARIDSNGAHLLNVINDILYWTGGKRDRHPETVKPVDARGLAESVISQLSSMAAEKSLAVSVTAGEGIRVHADETRLRQVLVNLVGNALKFTNQGHVKLHCEHGAQHVRFLVEDTGCGIPEDAREKIFEAFTQLDSSITRAQGGSGLGLAISRDIIRRHGGDIHVESVLGRGSVFIVTLPHGAAEQAAA